LALFAGCVHVSYLEAITKIIAALAWPVVTIFIFYMLRSGVLNVLNRLAIHVGRLRTARVPGIVHATFDLKMPLPPPIPVDVKEISP
jgi:hypothetical protein